MKNSSTGILGIVLLITVLLVASAAFFLLRDVGEHDEAGTVPAGERNGESKEDVSLDTAESDAMTDDEKRETEPIAVVPNGTNEEGETKSSPIRFKARFVDLYGSPVDGVEAIVRSRKVGGNLVSWEISRSVPAARWRDVSSTRREKPYHTPT